ncbi:MAG: hypothetical protein PHP30_03840 [Bacteroidales bacterium]|nr:hypothetical protein [Bacteroidales bacterium]MDD3989212.1 hypothetical protein [Bacteroidales bacterium]
MDVVDQKIYDIWEKFEIGIFYSDTLGWEDRGRVDESGNPIYYYEVLDPNYDMTSSASYSNKVTWTLIDADNPQEKATLMPLLEYLNSTLLAFIKDADVHIPAIMVARKIKRGSTERKVYRGFNYLALNLSQYNDDMEGRTVFRSEFISQTCAKKIESLAGEFRRITEVLVEKMITTRGSWGQQWDASPFFPEYRTVQKNIEALDVWDMDEIRARLEEFEILIANGDITDNDQDYLNCKDSVNFYNTAAANELLMREQQKKVDPKTYGFLDIKFSGAYYYSPTAVEDLDDYMKALFTFSTDDFEQVYEQWPVCVSRFKKLKELMISAGFDVDALRQGMI